MPDTLPDFDPHKWAARFRANAERSEMNQMQDSGWSRSVADTCTLEHGSLMNQLFEQLAAVEVLPSDLFDRPRLAAILAAVQEARQ